MVGRPAFPEHRFRRRLHPVGATQVGIRPIGPTQSGARHARLDETGTAEQGPRDHQVRRHDRCPSARHPQPCRSSHQLRQAGGNQQSYQNHQAQSLRLPGYPILLSQDYGG